MPNAQAESPSRGHRKKERTRRQLIEAGLRVLATQGDGLTVSDVVAEAEVSNGTFYNYFVDRDELLAVLAEHSAIALAAAAAEAPIDDPAERFAHASTQILEHARRDITWARVMLRLLGRSDPLVDIRRYLREDLADGFARNRFTAPPNDATLDLISGLVLMTIRRMVDGETSIEITRNAVACGLTAVGVDVAEAEAIARAVADDDGGSIS